jgi:hypothetical protein
MRRKTEEDVERAKAAVRRHFDDGLADDLDPEAARQFRLMMLSRDARKFVVDHERKQVSLQYDDDQTETLASQAKAGDEEANVILTAYAIEMLERSTSCNPAAPRRRGAGRRPIRMPTVTSGSAMPSASSTGWASIWDAKMLMSETLKLPRVPIQLCAMCWTTTIGSPYHSRRSRVFI